MASSNIKHVTVIGGGVMGSGIAMITAANGYRVTVVDVNEDAIGRAKRQVDKDMRRMAQHVSKGNEQKEHTFYTEAAARMTYSVHLREAVAATDLVIEAIVENLEKKQTLFKILDQAAPAHTILASNTSSLSIAEIGSSAERKDRIGGLHFFNPVPMMKLIEVVRTDNTSDATHETLLAFGKSLRKTCITCRDMPGFVVNRLLFPVIHEALGMVERKDATAHDIDVAMKLGLGHPMGPFELMDIVGLDTVCAIQRERYARNPADVAAKPSELLERMIYLSETRMNHNEEAQLDKSPVLSIPSNKPVNNVMAEWETVPSDLPAGVLQLENQVAGHTAAQGCLGLLKTTSDGTILKPTGKVLCGIREIAFYERLEEARQRKHEQTDTGPDHHLWTVLCQVVPRYFGHPKLTIDGKVVEFIQLEDLTEGLEWPCIMDVKIGRRTWDPLATPEKRKAEENKYKACRQRFGLCIPGFQLYSVRDGGTLIRHGKDYGKKLTEANIRDAFLLYLNATEDGRVSRTLLEEFLHDLHRIRDWARKQTMFRLYSSSVLLVYDAARLDELPKRSELQSESLTNAHGTPSVRARMIDFAHAFPTESSEADTVDENYLQGVESLLKSIDDGSVLKPVAKLLAGPREIKFYEQIEKATGEMKELVLLRDLTPQYRGHQKLPIGDELIEFLKLEDITHGMLEPCIMDVKIGRRSWDPLATEEKRQYEASKYAESREAYGFCIPGFQFYSLQTGRLQRYGKEYGKKLTKITVKDALRRFLNADGGLCRQQLIQLLKDLWNIQKWARTQTSFRLYASSVLLVYDARRLKPVLQHAGKKSPRTPNPPTPTSTSGASTPNTPTFCTTSINEMGDVEPLQHYFKIQRSHSTNHNFEEDIKIMKENYTFMLDNLVGSYEDKVWAKARMIDFAHTFPVQPSDPSGVDCNYLEGINNLVKLFEDLLKDCEIQNTPRPGVA
uniref:Kinase n=1 Tax=Anopheles culicifacies TaxID=139723 RepID=A0A182MAS9_9DIPT